MGAWLRRSFTLLPMKATAGRDAQQALRAEISRRGLDIVLKETPPPSDVVDEPHGDFDPADLDLVTAFRVWDLAEANV